MYADDFRLLDAENVYIRQRNRALPRASSRGNRRWVQGKSHNAPKASRLSTFPSEPGQASKELHGESIRMQRACCVLHRWHCHMQFLQKRRRCKVASQQPLAAIGALKQHTTSTPRSLPYPLAQCRQFTLSAHWTSQWVDMGPESD